jgi:hypothetical protein
LAGFGFPSHHQRAGPGGMIGWARGDLSAGFFGAGGRCARGVLVECVGSLLTSRAAHEIGRDVGELGAGAAVKRLVDEMVVVHLWKNHWRRCDLDAQRPDSSLDPYAYVKAPR